MTCGDCGKGLPTDKHGVQVGIRLVAKDRRGKEYQLCVRCFWRHDEARAVKA